MKKQCKKGWRVGAWLPAVAAGIMALGAAQAACAQGSRNIRIPDYSVLDDSKCIVIYDFIERGEDLASGQIKAPVSLQIGPKVSMFGNYGSFVAESLQYTNREKGLASDVYDRYVHRFNTSREILNLLRFHDRGDSIRQYATIMTGTKIEVQPDGTRFATPPSIYKGYYEDHPDTEWNITDEKRKIGDIEVTKATGRLHGRDWTVWFAESLPYFEGPWELAGLPGLILEAADSEGIFEFRFSQLRSLDTPILLNAPRHKQTTREEIRKRYADKYSAEMADYRAGKRHSPPSSLSLAKE